MQFMWDLKKIQLLHYGLTYINTYIHTYIHTHRYTYIVFAAFLKKNIYLGALSIIIYYINYILCCKYIYIYIYIYTFRY